MSDYFFQAKNKKTGEVVQVAAMDDYFGHHRYGYKTENRILTDDEFDLAYECVIDNVPISEPTPPPTGNYFQYRADPNGMNTKQIEIIAGELAQIYREIAHLRNMDYRTYELDKVEEAELLRIKKELSDAQ